MRKNAHYEFSGDTEDIKRLIRENPWATFVSSVSGGLVVRAELESDGPYASEALAREMRLVHEQGSTQD